MVYMSDRLVNITDLLGIAREQNKEHKKETISLVALKFNSENIEIARKITTEGMSELQRIDYIGNLKQRTSNDIFEFSTCNRVLYVGFGIEPNTLSRHIQKYHGVEEIPFSLYSGVSAWRHLVKICSGLDSFILGELQVMSQFRKSINFHRDNNFISLYNSSFFEHIISANRNIRKKFGFNQTTESMLSLATSSLKDILGEKKGAKTTVLGFGDMGIKAVETLLDLDQDEITVVSRNPQISRTRNVQLSSRCKMISYDEWEQEPPCADIVISTIRNSTPTYNSQNYLPTKTPAIVMDFSWPPSIDKSGLNDGQSLLGMEHWIQVARNLGEEWNYESTIKRSESMISEIQDKYMLESTDKHQAEFRSMIYSNLEKLSQEWEFLPNIEPHEKRHLRPFAREIATWICHKEKNFYISELLGFIENSSREISDATRRNIFQDVDLQLTTLNKMNSILGEA